MSGVRPESPTPSQHELHVTQNLCEGEHDTVPSILRAPAAYRQDSQPSLPELTKIETCVKSPRSRAISQVTGIGMCRCNRRADVRQIAADPVAVSRRFSTGNGPCILVAHAKGPG